MNARPLTDAQLSAALRSHLPSHAQAGLREEILEAAAASRQVRRLPTFLGALMDADPVARRRSLLVIAAVLIALALAGAAAVGALRLFQPPDPFRTDFVPATRGLLAVIRDGDLYLAKPDGTGAALAAHVDGSPLSSPKWSPDGRWIVVQTAEPAVLRLDTRTLELQRLANGTIGAWAPDGRSVALHAPSGEIEIVDVDTGASRTRIPRPAGTEGFFGEMAWSPDGRWLVASGLGLVRIDVTSGVVLTLDPEAPTRVRWSPDSRKLAYVRLNERSSQESGPLVVVDAAGASRVEVADPGQRAFDLAWSPDAAWIAFASSPGHAYQGPLAVVRSDGRDRRTVIPDTVAGIVGWSPDGLSIAYVTVGTPSPLFEVTVDRGETRAIPVAPASEFAWAQLPPSAAAPVVPTQSVAPPRPDESPALPAAGPAADPRGAWRGLAFFGQALPTTGGDGPCEPFVLTFPDRVETVPEDVGPPGAGGGPAASPTLATPAPTACGGVVWAPDGSAYMSVTFGVLGTFDVFGNDGGHRSGPMSIGGEFPIWSPDAAWIAANHCIDSACSRGGHFVVRPDGSNLRELPGRPAWSNDGQTMTVSVGDGTLLVGRPDGSDLRSVGTFPAPVGWDRDGSRFAYVRDGDVWIANRDGSGARNLTAFDLGGATTARWSPDGRWIVVLRGQTLWVFGPDDPRGTRIANGFTDPSASIAWSSDGSWLAVGRFEDVILCRAGVWEPVLVANAASPVWSPDGRYLAVASSSPLGTTIDVMNADGSGRQTAWTGGGLIGPVAWIR